MTAATVPAMGDHRKSGKKRGLGRRLRHAVAARVALALMAIVPLFRLETLQGIGAALGWIGARVPGKRRRRVVDHLEIAFPPGAHPDAERRRILRECYQSSIQIFLEVLWATRWSPKREDRLRVADPELLERVVAKARESGKGLIVYTAHLGAPELVGKWFVDRFGIPTLTVASRPKIRALEEPMRKVREANGLRQVYRGDAGTAALRHLKQGGALFLMVDHNLKGPGVEVPFFGRPAHTLLAPARLALQTGAVTTTIFGLRDGRGRLLLICEEPFEVPPYRRDREERLRQEADLTRRYTARIEDTIRKYPGQYLWMHRRWEKRSDTLPLPCLPSST